MHYRNLVFYLLFYLFILYLTLTIQLKTLFTNYAAQIWCSDNSVNHIFFEFPQYKSIHQVRRTSKGGGIAVFPHESLTFNIRHDLSVNKTDIQALCVEIISKKQKKILLTLSIVDQ